MSSAGHCQLLKDFLDNYSDSHLNIANNQNTTFANLSISRSSKATSTAVSAIQRAFNSIKGFHFNSIKSFSKVSRIPCNDVSVKVSVTRSFRDLVEDASAPSDDSGRCNSQMQCSGTSSVEEDELSRKDAEQCSPISILNFQFQEVEKHELPSHQWLENMERRNNMLMHNSQDFQYLRRLETIEADNNEKVYLEKKRHEEGSLETKVQATKYLNHVEIEETALNLLLFDFLHNELSTSANEDILESNLRIAKAWINGEHADGSEWEMRCKKTSCVREMDKGGRWSKFEAENQQLAFEVETGILDCLIDELLIDLFT